MALESPLLPCILFSFQSLKASLSVSFCLFVAHFLAQAALGGGGVTIPGGVQELCGRGTEGRG